MQDHGSLTNPAQAIEDTSVSQQRQVFRREGEYWTVSYEGVTCRLRDSKGMVSLAYLLTHPGEEIASWELMQAACENPGALLSRPSPETVERARVSVTKNIKVALLRIREYHPALADHLDATVRRGYACVYRPDPRVPINWT